MAKQVGQFMLVREVISLFIQMGCEFNEAEAETPDGHGSVFGLAYLLNPESGAAVPILDLGKNEFVSRYEVESWERRLGISIPKSPPGS